MDLRQPIWQVIRDIQIAIISKWKNVFKFLASYDELCQHSPTLVLLPKCFKNTVKGAGLQITKPQLAIGFGKCHFGRFTVHISTIKSLKKLCNPQSTVPQYLIMNIFYHIRCHNNQQNYEPLNTCMRHNVFQVISLTNLEIQCQI